MISEAAENSKTGGIFKLKDKKGPVYHKGMFYVR